MGIAATIERPVDQAVFQDIPTALASSAAWPELPANVRVIETHISWVFLTERYAYKLKKPVRFDFLDFSTLELRRKACFEELYLNRRLASETYLCVVPVVRSSDGRIRVQGDGVVVDWLVKMKRLPQDRALDVLIRTGDPLPARDIDRFADKLAGFYRAQPPVAIAAQSYRLGIERHVVANRDELAVHGLESNRIFRLHQAQMRFLKVAGDLLDHRVADGRIIEGHGDLRPEHVYLLPDPAVIDCIEFNREYRTLDIADELAFFSMECDLLGAVGVADTVIEKYCASSGDHFSRQLMDFYRLYRACVRAKVAAIRADQLSSDSKDEALSQAEDYLALAEQYAKSLGPPVVIAMQGAPGTGKSTVAEKLASELDVEHIQSDAVRREMYGPSNGEHPFNEGRYSAENRFRVYEEMHCRADKLLRQGLSLILDATYLASHSQTAAAETAQRHGAKLIVTHCHCPRHVALERIESRQATGNALSEARSDWFDSVTNDEPREVTSSRAKVVTIDTTRDISDEIKHVYQAIRESCLV